MFENFEVEFKFLEFRVVKQALTKAKRRSGTQSALSRVALPRRGHHVAAVSPPTSEGETTPTTESSWAHVCSLYRPANQHIPRDPHFAACHASVRSLLCPAAVDPLPAGKTPSSQVACLVPKTMP